MPTSEELRARGGHWIAAARSWIQRSFANGETVIWGSDTILRGDVTPRKIEELAAIAVAAYANKDVPENDSYAQSQKEMELVLTVGYLAPTKPGRDLVPVAVTEIKRVRKELEEMTAVLEEARVFAATMAQYDDGNGKAGSAPSTGVEWRSRCEWAADVAKKLGDILKKEDAKKSDRLPNLPPEANARGGA